MAEPHAHSQPIETYGLAPHNRNMWPSAHNRNIWPYNSHATAAPSRLADSFVLQLSVYPLLTTQRPIDIHSKNRTWCIAILFNRVYSALYSVHCVHDKVIIIIIIII